MQGVQITRPATWRPRTCALLVLRWSRVTFLPGTVKLTVVSTTVAEPVRCSNYCTNIRFR
ncbi:hypothetical protein PF010_g19453 [Phytophthora fragariae]|uniref:Uncharacterized protein n=1 Tax=Phytophthora fragariae TaxID=53985 RepID=A0A6A3HYC7_9STRA|nr:hypothetical protein PF011_g24864 [Phytophthora fragariae]KAE9088198.1 hypothetical protein PF010_g19453 [Phytophthora fragariae]KAE9180219.1 hypothetical protein PF004_g24902 [Phytophthora fragariae]